MPSRARLLIALSTALSPLALLAPPMIWAIAVIASWLAVDGLLLAQLRALQRRHEGDAPDAPIGPGRALAIAAHEIGALDQAFRLRATAMRDHEQRLAEGLAGQTRLTREVHHRVKNNLQIISSLITLHARGASTADASRAYASIQRRVDALAVVHRHHFAGIEATRGLGLRAIISDLTANLRATIPNDAAPAIRLDVDTTLVSQDVAVAVAFLVTEILELAMTTMPGAPIDLRLGQGATPDRAMLDISSPGLRALPGVEPQTAALYDRVIGGLARQLRRPIEQDRVAGRYRIEITAIGRD